MIAVVCYPIVVRVLTRPERELEDYQWMRLFDIED